MKKYFFSVIDAYSYVMYIFGSLSSSLW